MVSFAARILALFACAAGVAQALHFYLDATDHRCFIEELPTDTVVEGHYRALEWVEQTQQYAVNEHLGISVEVTEVDTAHLVVNSHGSSEGRFTFTSHEAGDHTICLATNASKSSTWFSSGSHVRLYLDVVVGSTKADVEHDRSHVSMLAGKVRELNAKLEEIRREQQYQREREADFRDLSESTNAKAVLYSIVQIGTLLATCFWQLRHLKRFFEERRV